MIPYPTRGSFRIQLVGKGFIVIFELMIFIIMMLKRHSKKATIE